MSSEEDLIKVRDAKHLEANGRTYPLASNNVPIYMSVGNRMQGHYELVTSIVMSEIPGNPYCFHGRVLLFRKSGSITFLKIEDSSGAIQLIASKAELPNYADLRLLDLGDIIEVNGKLCKSKTGELSVLVGDFKILSKAVRPPPEKWAGISNNELKQRKRYLDLMSSEDTRDRFIIRSYVIRAIRDYYEHEHFLEVETSTLNTISSGANAKPFTTHHNALDMDLFLRIAPELYLKRLLVGGLDKVFEIGRNYRNEGLSTRHNPEFTMLEAYEAYSNLEELISRTKKLFSSVDNYLNARLPSSSLVSYNNYKDNRSFTFDDFKIVSMAQAVTNALYKMNYTAGQNYAAMHMLSGTSEIQAKRRSLIDMDQLRHELSKAPTAGQRLSIVFDHIVEPFLVDDYRTSDGKLSCPVFITEYPKDICPLARANDLNPDVCDRFELFIDGRELCNAYQELNDPREQAIRFKEQSVNNGNDPMDIDHDYVEALEHGMPPAVGFGLGIDRTVMLFTNSSSIRDVILFPTMKNK